MAGGAAISETTEAFFVGGTYVQTESGQRMYGQAYIQRRCPDEPNQYPIVLIHGGHQTSMNFETTPDGRPGWSDFFLAAGFDTYLMDTPGRGRAAYLDDVYGPMGMAYTTARVEERNTAGRTRDLWPQAHLHTQWPGPGVAGDPAFDQFYASQSQCIADETLREQMARRAGAALLDKIGPAILVTHSQSGHFGWQMADARPSLVKAIVAVEPGGPPFVGMDTVGPPDYFRDGEVLRPYGLTATPVEFDPPVADPASDLSFARQDEPDAPGYARCHLLTEPRRMVNLVDVPVAVITGEASYHAGYDHCSVAFLRQCGVSVDHVLLADEGVHGNCHMMMLERNSDEIAAVIHQWLKEHDFAG